MIHNDFSDKRSSTLVSTWTLVHPLAQADSHVGSLVGQVTAEVCLDVQVLPMCTLVADVVQEHIDAIGDA